MAKVTFINAIVQGKLGGGVYSRNKGGYYIKSYSKPLNPATQAQIRARTTFGAAATAWHALTDLQKAQWNSYAGTHYRPKGGLVASVVSGFQAFVSLYSTALTGNQLARTNAITVPVGPSLSVDTYTFSSTPPAQEFSQMIQDSTGNPLPLLLIDGSVTASNANVMMEFDMVHSQANEPQFLDAVGSVPCGIMLQMSKPMTQSAQFVQSPNNAIVNMIKPIDGMSTWAASSTLTFTATAADFDASKYKTFPTAGEKVELSAYLVGESGQQAQLGSIVIEVS